MKLRSSIAAVAVSTFLLGACAATEAETHYQRLYALESGYIAAVGEAALYEGRPRCGSVGVGVDCSDPQVVAGLRRADNVAFASLMAARAAPTTDNLDALAASLRGMRDVLAESAR